MKQGGQSEQRRQRLVVIGGVAAGMSAASRAKRVNPELEVIVLERGKYVSYGACSLPYFVAGNFDDYRMLIARTPEEAAKRGVDVRTGHEVTAIDLDAGLLTVVVHAVAGSDAGSTAGSGVGPRSDAQQPAPGASVSEAREEQIPFDILMLATGAEAIVPPAWGVGTIEGAFLLRTIDDARAIRQWIGAPDVHTAQALGTSDTLLKTGLPELDAQQAGVAVDAIGADLSDRSVADVAADHGRQHAVVIGGGYIGVEAVDALLRHGVTVTLVDMAPQLLTNFDPDIAAYVEQDLREAGVDVRLGDGVSALESEDGRITGVRLASGEFVAADVAVVALGVRPNVGLAQAAGIALGETGAIAVDSQQRTNLPHVFAAGDCCEAHHLVTGRPAYIPLGTTANKQGRVAGTVIGGGEASFTGIVGTAVLKAYNVSVARTGLTEQQARSLGYDAVSATITANDRADSYPGVQDVVVKLVAEKGAGRLLGAQIAGREALAVSGRIDVVATALVNRMHVDAFADLDLSYAPPFAPVWDPLLVAANVLQRKL